MAEWIREIKFENGKVEVEWDKGIKTTIGYGIDRVVIDTEHGELFLRNGEVGIWKFATIRYEVTKSGKLWVVINIR